MASRYSVIQYVPNPIADERINIGVLAFDEKGVRVHFLQNWERVRCFGRSEDIDLLKNFAHEMQEVTEEGLLFPGDRPSDIPAHERLLKVAHDWTNGIQFTEPRGSLVSLEQLLDDLVKNFLLDPEKKQKLRDRAMAARITVSMVKEVLGKRLGEEQAKRYIKKDISLKGTHKQHKFDVAVANGRPYLAAHGLSFEVHAPESVQGAVAWMIGEVKEVAPKLPLAIVALPPVQGSFEYKKLLANYENMTSTYQDMGAQVINENQVEQWLSEQIEALNLV
jgi:Protein of unknown function (DUF3037)